VEVLTPKTNDLIASYCSSFKSLYGDDPHISPKDAGIAKRLAKITGIEDIMKAFFESKDEFIIKSCHSLSIIESQINKLLIKGKPRKDEGPSTLDKIKKEEEAIGGKQVVGKRTPA
jgi:hypothetical protein